MKSVLASLRLWMAAFIVTPAGQTAVLFGLAFAMASGLVSISVSAQVVAYPVDTITTVAGTGLTGGTTCAGTGAAASTTALRSPVAAAVDGSANVYVIDGNCVLKLSSSNTLTTVAGTGTAGFSGDGGLATNAQLDAPAAIALDTNGNIYIADTGNNRIREITVSNGIINTVAGSGPAGAVGSFGGDYNYAVDALLNQPKGIAVDVYGEMFIADTNNQRIREVSTNGVIFTVAGNGTAGYNGDDVPSLTIQSINQELNYPEGIMLDGSSNLYIADSGNNRIRRLNYYNGHVYINGVQWSGAMFTVAGDGTYGGLGDFGPATSAELGAPNAVAVNTSVGSLWISDASHRVRQVDFDSGIIHTVAGTGNEGFSGDGGPAVLAQMGVFTAVAADFSGNLYIADRDNLRVRLVSVPPALSFPNTAIGSTSASQTFLFETGASESISSVQVTGASNPNGADFTANLTDCSVGVTYAAGTLCSVAAAFKPAFPGLRSAPAVVTTSQGTFQAGLSGIGLGAQANFLPATTTIFAGTGTPGDTGDGGPAASAQLNAPQGLWANGDGSLLIVDSGNDSVRRVTSDGTISTVDGAEGTFGLGRSAVEDSAGNLFFSSQGIVYRLDANTGAVTTYAGASGTDGLTNGVDANLATFTSPTSMAFDSSGNLYIADSGTNLVRRISAQNHQIVTVAGNGTAGDSGDSGLATNAAINGPLAIAIDASGNVYIAEGNGNRVRKVSATTGTISTVAGNGTAANTGDGGAATSASLNAPNGIAVDAAGNLYIVAPPSLRIVFSGSQTITTVGGTSFVSPCCAAVDGAGNIYVSDSSTGAGGSVVYKVPTATPPSFTFATTGINQTSSDSPKAATIWDSGNASLGYLVPGTGANPSVSANFTYDAANSGACAQSFAGSSMVALPVGQDCTFPISFTPTSVGDISGSLVLTDNSDSASSTTQTIPLNGIGEDGLVKFTLTGLVNAVSGSPQTLTVTAINQTNGTLTGYLGTVHFSSTDPVATLPADYTFTAADAGQHIFSLALNSLGAQTVTATDTTTTSDTGSETVTISPLTFVLTGLVAGSSGQSQTLTVRATNSGGATLTSFTGTVTFTSTDPAATLPTNYTFTAADAGVHTFTLTLNTTGTQTVTATDTASATETGSESVIISAPTLALTGLAAGSSGQQQAVTVKVTNSGGTTLTSFTGTVAFTSNDPAATLPANYTFTAADAGVHTFTLELRTAGTDSVTVTEVQVPAATATQTAAITATHFTVTGPATVTAGTVQSYTVQALTTADTVLANYVGTVDITNTDTAATFPASCLFTTAAAGTCVISVTFQTTGSQTLAATDAEIAAQSGSEVVTVNPAPYTLTASLPVSQTATIGSAFASPLTVTLRDPSGNPVAGATVTFAAPATGASALLSSTSVATNSSGVASIPATANGTAGIYTVTASTSNVSTPATFYLTNAKVTEALALTAQVQAVTGSDNVVLTAVLSPTSAGGSVPSGTISFYDGGTLLSVQTVANAQASFTEVNPGQGTHNYSATYSGDGNFSEATGTATALVSQSTATVTLSNLNQTYNGSPKPVTVTVSPGGLAYSVTYNGSATVPTNAGSYTVVATVTTSGYIASSTGTLVIAKGTASFIFQAEPAVTYNGKPQPFDDPVAVLTGPSNPTFTYTYNGSSTVPTNAGGYTVVATLVDSNWQATVQDFWVISYVAVTTSFTVSPNVTYGQPVTVQGSISPAAENSIPAGGVFQFTSNSANLGSPAALMNGTASYTYYPPAGTYSLGGTYSGDPNYLPVYLGSPRAVVVSQASTTLTSSAAQPVQIAYGTGTSIPLIITGQYSGAGIAVPTGPVVYNIGSGSQMTAVSTNGIASITIPSTLDAGTYTVTATYNGDSNYLPSSTTITVIVSKATANVTLSGLNFVYNGSPQPVTATTTPGGLPVTLTYNGSATAPSTVGSYAVVATVNTTDYSGSATGTLVISQAPATVSLSSLSATYDGNPHPVIATTTPSGVPVTLTYNGSSTVPSAQGSYTVVATINNLNYTGSASGILVISKSTATVTLGNLSATYDGNPHPATATTTPSGLNVTLTYNGSTTAPTAVGSYTVVGTINDPDYSGSSTGTLVISREAATVTLGNLSATYNGSPQSASATTNPLNLAVALTYNGSSTPPTAAGSYTVVGTISDPQYSGTATGTLIIAKATARVSLNNLSVSYDGNSHAATVTTTPPGLTVSVTYNGSTTAPSAIGNYTVVATVVDPNYTGSATGTLTISSTNAIVALSNLIASYDGNPHAATATTNPVGLSVAITYNGSATVPVAAGNYAVVATITSASYSGSTTGTLVIAKAAATVTLSNLAATYDGNQHAAAATTVPSGLSVTFTYNGSATVPSAVGNYAVVATITDPNYTGTAIGTLTISSSSAPITLGNLSATYDGNPHAATATINPSGLSVSITYNGSTNVPVAAGSYTVVATITSPGYSGSTNGTLVIAKANAVVTLGNLAATYNGSPQNATATTTPAGLAVSFTYNGTVGAPSAIGTYTVVASVIDPNYTGSASGVLVISQASAAVTLSNLNVTYDGNPHAATATTNPAGLPVSITYNGSSTVPVAAGSYAVVATVTSPNYMGSTSGTLMIEKLQP